MSLNMWAALKAPFNKALFGSVYSGSANEIAKDNGYQDKVFDPNSIAMNSVQYAGTARGRTHLNNPNGVSVNGVLATPAAPTVTPTGGTASTWTYLIVARASNGTTAAGATGSTTTGVTTLTGSAYNTITWAAIAGATSYDIYRTVCATGPTTTGKIGNVLASATLSFVDTGIAGDTSTAPTINTTGVFEALAVYDFTVVGIQSPQLTTVTPFGTVGSTSYSYAVAAVTAVGTLNIAAAVTATTGNATLTTAHGNTIAWAAVPGAVSYNVYRTASSGTPGTTGLIGQVTVTSAATFSFSDTGIAVISAAVPVAGTNTTGQGNISGSAQSSVTKAVHFYAGGVVPIATTTGTDTAGINGTLWISEIFIPANCTVTGISYLIGSVGGTDKVVVALFNSAGAIVANSVLDASVTVGTTATFQRVPFTAPVAVVGPGLYYVGVQTNGTTAKVRTQPFGNHNAGTVSQVFDTLVAITPPATFTASTGPIALLY